MDFPVLTAIVAVPIIAAVIILFMNAKQRDLIRGVAISAAAIVLGLSFLVYFNYNNEVSALTEANNALADAEYGATQMFTNVTAFEERVPWIESIGLYYHVGVDGLSVPMVLLTSMVTVTGVLISWNIQDRIREFYAFFMLLVAGVFGVFIAVDLFLLFFFFEFAIFPMYILIAGWGWVKLREYAAMKLTLYILIGSVIALIGAIAIYFAAGQFFTSPDGMQVLEDAIALGAIPADSGAYSFNIQQLTLAAEAGAFDIPYLGSDSLTFAKFWFPFVFIGLGILAGMFPFHNWSPDGHVAAPTAVSMIHAGVLMKMGAYAAIRVGIQILPEGAEVHLPWIIFLTLVNVVYGALIAFRQRDFKYVIGFSSVSHMGLVIMGWSTMNMTGMTGAGLQMFSHGAMTALFFGCVGMVYDRAHTRDIPSLGGFIKVMPWVGVAFIIGGLTSMGMPGFSGFIAEFPIFQGLWQASDQISLTIGGFTLSNYYSIIVILSAIAIVVTAAYVLRVAGQVFFGDFDAKRYADVGDIAITDRIILIILAAPLIIIGLFPSVMAPMISSGLQPVLALLGG